MTGPRVAFCLVYQLATGFIGNTAHAGPRQAHEHTHVLAYARKLRQRNAGTALRVTANGPYVLSHLFHTSSVRLPERRSAIARGFACAAMPKHLSLGEQAAVDKVVRLGPMDALHIINKLRKKQGADELNKSTIYRYLKGKTHRRGTVESRGRKQRLGEA